MRNWFGFGSGSAVLAAVAVVSCVGSKTQPAASGGRAPTDAGARESSLIATDRTQTRAAHHFTARAHEPHYPAAVAALPPLASMPKFVDGSAQCFPQPPVVYQSPPYPTRYRGGAGTGAGIAGGALVSGGSAQPAKPKPSRALPSSPVAEGAAPGTASKDAYAAAPPPAAAAPAPPALAPPPAPAAAAPGDGRADSAASKKAPEAKRERAPEPRQTASEFDDRRKGDLEVAVPPPARQREPEWGAGIYLSNDDTMSLSSAQRVLWAIDHYAPIPQEHVRPHELLNYFSFDTRPVERDHDFSVLPHIEPSPENPNLATLALSVRGRPATTETRRNVNLAYVVDRSGSMQAEGRMEYLKRGLLRSLKELKQGDIVHVTLFDTNACDLVQNFVVGRDPLSRLEQLIRRIEPLGSTNLHDGLNRGYASVDRSYQPTYSNRVVLVTDALANTGVTDPVLLATVAKHYDDRRVRLSGVGVGTEFNDSLLDGLTEAGKGAYVFLGSEAEVDAVFGSRFVSLVETVANDVHFKLQLPPSLAMQTFYGEEASTVKERVQAVHYFANTSQLFLSDLVSRDGRLPTQDDILFTIEYQDPESGAARVEEFAWNLGEIAGRAPNLDKARLVSLFARSVGSVAERPLPAGYTRRSGGWADVEAVGQCQTVRGELARLAVGIAADREVTRVQGLWDQLCSRYAYQPPPPPVARPQTAPPPNDWPSASSPHSPPVRNNDYAPPDAWPGAR